MHAPVEPARGRTHRLWPVALIAPVAIAHIAALLSVLHMGMVHPVRYELALPPGATIGQAFGISFVLLALVVVAGFAALGVGLARRRQANAAPLDLVAKLPFALAPAVAAPAWLVPGIGDARFDFLLLMLCVLLVGWSLARLLAPLSDPGASGSVSPSAPALSPVSAWWQEPWFIAIGMLAVACAMFHTYVQIKLHDALQYGAPDIGYYAEMLVNAARGRGLWCEAFGHDYFGEHFSPGLYLLVPFWMCWPDIHLLMALGALSISAGAPAVYALARAYDAPPWVAGAAAIAFLAYPSAGRVIYGASYGFHEILLAIPLMLWSFHFWRGRRWGWMLACTILAISLKENVAIVYACFGLYAYLHDRSDRWGLWLAGACAVYFLAAVMWVVPAFNENGTYSKYYLYASLGGSPAGVLTSFLRDPSHIVGRLFSWQAAMYALSLFVPLAMLVLTRPVVLVALPTLVFICLMDNPAFASVRFWHQSSALPVLWLAAIQAVARRPRDRTATGRRAAALLLCSLFAHYALGFSPASRTWRDFPLDRGDRSELIDHLHEMIPKEASVQATPRLASHFYDQARIHPFQAEPADHPGWIILDTRDSFTARGFQGANHGTARRPASHPPVRACVAR